MITTPRVLLVDDSPTARSMIARSIGPGYAVETAGGGPEALASIAASPPDLVLLDLLMPGMDGFAVLAALRDSGSAVPVLVVSADIQETTRRRVMELGAAGIVHKPPKPELLARAMEAALRGGASA